MVNSANDEPPLISYQALNRAQGLSGVVIAAFTALHVGNAASVWAGPFAYDQVQSSLRVLYRGSKVVEFTLLGAIAVHGTASFIKLARRNATVAKIAQSRSTPFATKMHSFTGMFLLAAVGTHIFATRILPDFIVEPDIDTGPIFGKSALIAHSLIGWRQVVMLPYYSLLLFSGSVHAFHGLQKVWSVFQRRRQVNVLDEALGKPTRRELIAYSAWFVVCALTAQRFTNPAALSDVPLSALKEVDFFSFVGRKFSSFADFFGASEKTKAIFN
jgi:succinate dehydrogenase/fumarate reductase cytochrome b subunit